jgi:hypothetical protein
MESAGKDTSFFKLGPWQTFGITEDTVQIAVDQSRDQRTVVDGILYCENGTQPTLEEYEKYLGFNYDTDELYSWVREIDNMDNHAFMMEDIDRTIVYIMIFKSKENSFHLHQYYFK